MCIYQSSCISASDHTTITVSRLVRICSTACNAIARWHVVRMQVPVAWLLFDSIVLIPHLSLNMVAYKSTHTYNMDTFDKRCSETITHHVVGRCSSSFRPYIARGLLDKKHDALSCQFTREVAVVNRNYLTYVY